MTVAEQDILQALGIFVVDFEQPLNQVWTEEGNREGCKVRRWRYSDRPTFHHFQAAKSVERRF